MEKIIKKYLYTINLDEGFELISGFMDYLLTPFNEKISIKEIVEIINHHFNIDIMYRSSKREFTKPRQMFFYILFNHYNYTPTRISVLMKYRESTVRHGIKTCEDILNTDKYFVRDYVKVMELINKNNI